MTSIAEQLQQGWRWHQQGRLAMAVDCYQQVLAAHPRHPEAWCYLGIALYDIQQFAESEQAYRTAIGIRENFPVAWSNLGNTLSAQGRFEEAAAACRRAIELKPGYATAWMNLGAALVKAGRFPEAEAALRESIALSPGNNAAHRNLSAALVQQGELQAGKQSAETAVQINPRDAEAHRNLALVRMLHGEWPEAFEEFEWRWRTPGMALPDFAQPLWDGRSLPGRTILLHAEQGLGDTLQFVRYAERVRRRASRVVVQCQPPLLPILRSFPHADQVVARGEALPAFDAHCPLMSLPRVLGDAVDTVPRETPYLFADPARVDRWRRRLPAARLRIGVAWQGSRAHHSDRFRSVPLAEFAPLAAVPGVRLVSLQKGESAEQIAARGDFELLDFGDELDADAPFLDTAALIACLDLVVTVDTAVAHLAGALHATTWIALSNSPDWRWLLQRSDSVWYPSATLYRRTPAGTWAELFRRMAGDLSARLAK